MIRWWLFEEPLRKLRIFGCKRCWSLKFLMCWSSNFDVSLQLDWLVTFDDSLNRRWWDLDDFDAQTFDEIFFVLVIPETLMFQCCFVDDSLMTLWRDLFETLICSMETFLIFLVFVVLTSESLMFHCFSIHDPLMTLWRSIDNTSKVWMQMLKILEVSKVIIIRLLMFLCCLIDYSLVILWWVFDNTSMISMQTLMMNNFFCANLGDIDVSLLLPWWVVDDALEGHCWSIDNFEGNFFDLHCFCCANLWMIDFSLLVLWEFVDDSLEKHWRYSEDFIQTLMIINVFIDLISDTLMFHCCLID